MAKWTEMVYLHGMIEKSIMDHFLREISMESVLLISQMDKGCMANGKMGKI